LCGQSDKAEHILGELRVFMDEHLYPNEKALLDHQVSQSWAWRGVA
jgi:hypothetical protein